MRIERLELEELIDYVNRQPQKDASGGRIQPLAQQSNAFLRQLALNLKFHPWLQSLRSTTAFGG